MTSFVSNSEPKSQVYNHLHCRYCGAVGLDRIPRGYLAKTVFVWLPLQHFICYRCLKKQYKFQHAK